MAQKLILALTTALVALSASATNNEIANNPQSDYVPGHYCTDKLSNPHFNEGFDGWIGMNANQPACDASSHCGIIWNTNTGIYQELTGVPNGVYVVTVNAYYSPSSYLQPEDKDADVPAYLFLNGQKTPLKSILNEYYMTKESGLCAVYNDTEKAGESRYYPREAGTVSEYFAKGYYQNTVECVVTDGVLKFGLYSDCSKKGSWTIFDNFQVLYKGNIASTENSATAINAVANESTSEISTVSGVQTNKLQNGVNIVRHDGETKKVLNK